MEPKSNAPKKPPLDVGHENGGLQVDTLDSIANGVDKPSTIEMHRL